MATDPTQFDELVIEQAALMRPILRAYIKKAALHMLLARELSALPDQIRRRDRHVHNSGWWQGVLSAEAQRIFPWRNITGIGKAILDQRAVFDTQMDDEDRRESGRRMQVMAREAARDMQEAEDALQGIKV